MPYRFTIDEKLRTVFFHAEGELTPSEFLDCLVEVVADPGFRPGFNHLVDLTCCTRLRLSAQHMRQRTDADQKLGDRLGSGQCALVTNSFFLHAVTRIYKILMRDGPLQIELFSDLAQACRWLGLATSLTPCRKITAQAATGKP